MAASYISAIQALVQRLSRKWLCPPGTFVVVTAVTGQALLALTGRKTGNALDSPAQ